MRIVFVFAGLLEYKGRLLKQIATLQEAGYECTVIHGQKESVIPDYSKYSFHVIPYRIVIHSNKVLNFYRHMKFNLQALSCLFSLVPDYVVCVELMGVLSGSLYRLFRRKSTFVFDCNELFMEMGMSKAKKVVWGPIHWFAFKQADFILHAEINRLKYCSSKYSSNAKNVLIENLPRVATDSIVAHSQSKICRAVYIGALIPSRGCEEIIQAFSMIPDHIACCDIIGFGFTDYLQHLHSIIDMNHISNVKILPPISNSNIFNTLSNYDVGFAFYGSNNLNQYYCAPNKIYEYIVAGLAVITNDYPGLKQVVETISIGYCLKSTNPVEIRNAVLKVLKNNIRNNIKDSIRSRYTWQTQENRYLSIFSHTESIPR